MISFFNCLFIVGQQRVCVCVSQPPLSVVKAHRNSSPMKKKQKLQESILSDSIEYGELTRKTSEFTTATATTATTGDETNSAVQNLQQVTHTLMVYICVYESFLHRNHLYMNRFYV